MSERKWGTILSYSHIIIANVISLIYTPFMLRMLGQSEYGLYGTANSFIAYLSMLNFGIGGAYIRFNARCRVNNNYEEEKQLNGMFLTIFSLLSLLVLVVGLFFIAIAGYLVQNTYSSVELYKLRVIMLILILNMVMTFICTVIMMSLQAYEKFIVIRIVLLVMAVINPIFNIIALKMGGKAISITFISFLLSALSYLIFYLYAKHYINLQFSFHGFKKDVVKELFVFSSFLFINSITDQITFSTDNIILSAVKGTAATAVYTVGASFRIYFQNFSTSISSVFAPKINMIVASTDNKTELNQLFQKVGRIQFYIVSLILIGYTIVGQKFVELWAGADYKDAYWIGLLLILSIFVPSIQNIGLEIQKALNKHKARSIVYFLIACLNVLLTIPACIIWGGIGAAAATTLCMFFGTVVFMNWYYWKKIKLDILSFWKSIFSIIPGFILPIIIGIFLINQYEITSLYGILIISLIICTSYFISIWNFSMNKYEKDICRSVLKKLSFKNYTR